MKPLDHIIRQACDQVEDQMRRNQERTNTLSPVSFRPKDERKDSGDKSKKKKGA